MAVSVCLSDGFRQVAHYLRDPIPTLHEFSIIAHFGPDVLEIPPSTGSDYLLHMKKLHLEGMWWFRAPRAFPHVTKFPNLTSLFVNTAEELSWSFPILLVTSFDKHLPNLAELLEMGVYTCDIYSRIFFRSPSRALLEHHAHFKSSAKGTYHHDRKLWGGLPLYSV